MPENKESPELNQSHPEGDAGEGFILLDKTQSDFDLTIRDDQFDFYWLQDAVRLSRKKGKRFRLVDSGSLESIRLEWLAEAGADIYTSSDVERKISELETIQMSCRKGSSLLVYLLKIKLGNGSQNKAEEQDEDKGENSLPYLNLARTGVYFHVPAVKTDEYPFLKMLARECRRGGTRLVYYHHGSFQQELFTLADEGSWIHFSPESLKEREEDLPYIDLIKLTQKKGANTVFHIDEKPSLSFLYDIVEAGAAIIFRRASFDFKSPFRPLQEKARERKLDFRAYYLYPNFIWNSSKNSAKKA